MLNAVKKELHCNTCENDLCFKDNHSNLYAKDVCASENFYILDYPVYLGILMPTILVKNVTKELLKELRRLKVEFGCKTWAELLELLIKLSLKENFTIKEKDAKTIKDGIKEFLELHKTTSEKWRGPPSVLEEFRRSRRHGNN